MQEFIPLGTQAGGTSTKDHTEAGETSTRTTEGEETEETETTDSITEESSGSGGSEPEMAVGAAGAGLGAIAGSHPGSSSHGSVPDSTWVAGSGPKTDCSVVAIARAEEALEKEVLCSCPAGQLKNWRGVCEREFFSFSINIFGGTKKKTRKFR